MPPYLIDLILERCEEAFSLLILSLKARKDQWEEWLLTQKRHTTKEVTAADLVRKDDSFLCIPDFLPWGYWLFFILLSEGGGEE